MRKLCVILIACAFVVGPMAATTHAGKTAKPFVVGTDPVGDWDAGGGVEGPIGDALGQDLVEAQIGMADAKTINFIIVVNSLLPIGGTPEVTRYTWELSVDYAEVQLDGKFTNYSRGICDPTAGTCPPPRNPGMSPFFIRTDCEGDTGATVCQEKGIVQATFDAAKGTITIPVPMKLLGAKPGSKIRGASFFFSGITATPSAFASVTGGPSDQLFPNKTFVIP